MKTQLRKIASTSLAGMLMFAPLTSVAHATEPEPATTLFSLKKQLDPTGIVGDIFPFHLRIGAMVSPRTKFIGGIDFTTNGLAPNFNTRIDAEAIVSANFGGGSTLFPVTVNQVYSKGLIGGSQVYGGFGLGVYFGNVSRFGGKLFIGTELTRKLGGELGLHFAGYGDPLVTAQVRLRL